MPLILLHPPHLAPPPPDPAALLEAGLALPNDRSYSFVTYESNVLFAMRFMVDKAVVGGNWVELPAGGVRGRGLAGWCAGRGAPAGPAHAVLRTCAACMPPVLPAVLAHCL